MQVVLGQIYIETYCIDTNDRRGVMVFNATFNSISFLSIQADPQVFGHIYIEKQ